MDASSALGDTGLVFGASHGRKRTKAGRYASDVTLEELQRWFHLPTDQACKKLGVGLTILKRIARRYGIKRWPYCKPRKGQAPPKPSGSSSSKTQHRLAPHASPTSTQPPLLAGPNPFATHWPEGPSQRWPGAGVSGTSQQAGPTGGPAGAPAAAAAEAAAAAAASWFPTRTYTASGEESAESAPTDCGVRRAPPSSPSASSHGFHARKAQSDPTPQSAPRAHGPGPGSRLVPLCIQSPTKSGSSEGKMGALLAAIEQSEPPEHGAVAPQPMGKLYAPSAVRLSLPVAAMWWQPEQQPARNRTASSTPQHRQQHEQQHEQHQQHEQQQQQQEQRGFKLAAAGPSAAAAAAEEEEAVPGPDAPLGLLPNPFLWPSSHACGEAAAPPEGGEGMPGALGEKVAQVIPLLQHLAELLAASPELTAKLVEAMGSVAPLAASQQQGQQQGQGRVQGAGSHPRTGISTATAAAAASSQGGFSQLQALLAAVPRAGRQQQQQQQQAQQQLSSAKWGQWGSTGSGWNNAPPPPEFTSQSSAPPIARAASGWQPNPLLQRSDSTPPMVELLPGLGATPFQAYASAPLGPTPHGDPQPAFPWGPQQQQQARQQEQQQAQQAQQQAQQQELQCGPSAVEGLIGCLLGRDASNLLGSEARLSSKQSCSWPWQPSGTLPTLASAAACRTDQQPMPLRQQPLQQWRQEQGQPRPQQQQRPDDSIHMPAPPTKKQRLMGPPPQVLGEASGCPPLLPQQHAGPPSQPMRLASAGSDGTGTPLGQLPSPFGSCALPLQQAPSLSTPTAAATLHMCSSRSLLMPPSPLGANCSTFPLAFQPSLINAFTPRAQPLPPHQDRQQQQQQGPAPSLAQAPSAPAAAQEAATEGALSCDKSMLLLARLMRAAEAMKQKGQVGWPASSVHSQHSVLSALMASQQAKHACQASQTGPAAQQQQQQQQVPPQLHRHYHQQHEQQQQHLQQRQLGPEQGAPLTARASTQEGSAELQAKLLATVAAWRAARIATMQQAQALAQSQLPALDATSRGPPAAAEASNDRGTDM